MLCSLLSVLSVLVVTLFLFFKRDEAETEVMELGQELQKPSPRRRVRNVSFIIQYISDVYPSCL